jgi:ribosome-associated heat shock protein Hsp15
MSKVRIDKWLWSVRIFKSRTLATDACKEGKVKVAGINVKPSQLVGEKEEILVKKEGFNFQYRVIIAIDKRVGAPIAATAFEDITPEEEKNKYTNWFSNQTAKPEMRERGTGRPTKRDRREIDDFKEG